MRPHPFLLATIAVAAITAWAPSRAHAQAATFSRFDDAVAGRCYEPATTAPDAADPNLLRIGMAACTASAPNGSAIVMDTFAFEVTAPEGFYISSLTFTQNGTTSGSRSGRGFYGAVRCGENQVGSLGEHQRGSFRGTDEGSSPDN